MRAIGLLAIGGVMAGSPAGPQSAGEHRRLNPAIAAEFYTYTLPLLEVARRRDEQIAHTGANVFKHERALLDDRFREVTTPNNDTLYSRAFIDLARGPARISIPATGTRYFSLAMMDAWSNNFVYLGTRATGGRATSVVLIGPHTRSPVGQGRVIVSPTRWVWLLGRTLVTGSTDLAAGIRVQNGIKLAAPVVRALPAKTPPRDADAETLRRAALKLMADTVPPAADTPSLARFRAAGLLAPQLSAADVVILQRGFDQGREQASKARRPGELVNGWIYAKQNLGDFGTDYAYRAAIAVTGLAAMGRKEAMNLRSAPGGSGLLDGSRAYQLHFAMGALPPVNAFWSLSLYERTADGGYYFTANEVHRYSFSDRTPGARKNSDGSLDIWIGHADPGPERRSNWLPAPTGPFALALRVYLPKPAILDGRWRAPAVETLP